MRYFLKIKSSATNYFFYKTNSNNNIWSNVLNSAFFPLAFSYKKDISHNDMMEFNARCISNTHNVRANTCLILSIAYQRWSFVLGRQHIKVVLVACRCIGHAWSTLSRDRIFAVRSHITSIQGHSSVRLHFRGTRQRGRFSRRKTSLHTCFVLHMLWTTSF